jgi:hypothetical protein
MDIQGGYGVVMDCIVYVGLKCRGLAKQALNSSFPLYKFNQHFSALSETENVAAQP